MIFLAIIADMFITIKNCLIVVSIVFALLTGTDRIPAYTNLVFDVHLRAIDRNGVGWEDLDTRARTYVNPVTKDDPLKMVNQGDASKKCDARVSEGKWPYLNS